MVVTAKGFTKDFQYVFFSAFKLPFFDPFVIFVGDLGQFVENIKEGSKFAVIDFCSEEVEIE